MKTVSYQCDCGNVFKLVVQSKIEMKTKCPKCGQLAKRLFNVTVQTEDDNITAAIEIMKYSNLPSGKTKRVI